jgi:WD40 repeat protein
MEGGPSPAVDPKSATRREATVKLVVKRAVFVLRSAKTSTALCILHLCAGLFTAAYAEELPRRWQKKITSKTVGAPYTGVIPPSIWAVAFSPDAKTLAVGIGIVESRSAPYKDFKSYVALISTDQPDSPMRTFEVSAKPWGNGPRMAWSADGKYMVIDHLNLQFDAYLLEIETGREYAIPRDECNVLGIISGPRLVMGCFFVKKVVRLVNLNGVTESEWPVSARTVNAGFAVRPGWLALAVDPKERTGIINPYTEFALIRADDHAEINRWSFTEVYAWSGALSASGSVFCNLFYDSRLSDRRRLTCRDVSTGREIGSVATELKGGRSAVPLAVGGNSRVTVDEGTFLPGYRSVWDVQNGRRLAHWPVRIQRVLPKDSWPAEYLHSRVVYPFAISPDGTTIAEGGSGVITLYRLPD